MCFATRLQKEEFRENSIIAEKKLQQILGEKDDLSVQRAALDASKTKLDTDLNEQRSIKTTTQNENLQFAATKRAVENDIQIAKVCERRQICAC